MFNKNKFLIFSVIIITVLAVFLNGCKKDDDDAPVEAATATIGGEEFVATTTSSQKNTVGGFTLQLSQDNTAITISTNGTEAGEYIIGSSKKSTKGKTATASVTQNGTVTHASTGSVTITANGGSKVSGSYDFTAGIISVSGGKFNNVAVAEGVAPSAETLELVSGDKQSGGREKALTDSIVVIVKDQNNNVFKGAKVTFTASDGGSTSLTTVTTGSDGKATVTWTLGTTPGTHTLTVKADDITPISVTATCKLEIGEVYAGGYIFYLLKDGDAGYDNDVQHGLVCAKTDQSTGIQWDNGKDLITGATGRAVLTGKENTTTIIDKQGTSVQYAARICDEYDDGNGNTDWFLPSKDELKLMYDNLYYQTPSIGGFLDYYYWSSSQESIGMAWILGFLYGNEGRGHTNWLRAVRAVRAF